jgi:hypothetical protein
MALRFANAANLVRDLWKVAKPADRTDALLRFGPDLFFAGMAGAMAPEGTSGGQRALIGLEDAAIGLGSSMLLGGGARLGAQKLLRNPTSHQVNQAGILGDMLAMPVNMFAPRPAFESAVMESMGNQHEQQAFLQQRDEDVLQQQALAALLQSSGLLG